MRNVSEKVVREIKTYNIGSIIFSENSDINEIMWKEYGRTNRSQMTIWNICIACWVPNNTNTHTEYVILIAVQRQHWLHARTSMLRCTYIACLVQYSMFTDRI
jgi:hypothetical protein